MRQIGWIGLGLISWSLGGCSPANVSSKPSTSERAESNTTAVAPSSESPEINPAAPVEATSGDSQVAVELRSWDEVQQWVQQQKGKVVVVDVWSTWCLACMREFPHFVAMQKKFPDQLVCASVSVDYFGGADEKPADVQPRVLEFLTSKQAQLTNFLCTDADEQVLTHIGAVAIPVALVFDREGKLHTTFKNDDAEYGPEGFGYEKDITPLVERLLQASTEPTE